MKDSIDFARMNIPQLFRKLLIPTVLGMVFSVAFVITDGVFVGHGIGSDALAAVNITAPLFRNPLVSVVTRMIAPLAAHGLQRLLLAAERRGKEEGHAPRKAAKIAIDAVCAAVGVVANTALVLGMIWLLYGGKTVGDSAITPEFMSAMISINFVIELIAFTLLTPPIVYAINAQEGKHASGN